MSNGPTSTIIIKTSRNFQTGHPPLFALNSLKSPLNWPKKYWGRAPFFFQILDPPLQGVTIVVQIQT